VRSRGSKCLFIGGRQVSGRRSKSKKERRQSDDAIIHEAVHGSSLRDIAKGHGLTVTEVRKIIDEEAAQAFNGEQLRREVVRNAAAPRAGAALLRQSHARRGGGGEQCNHLSQEQRAFSPL
jgi:hypothetical protein